MKNILLFLTASFVLLFSCTTQQKVTFNSDWSGKVFTSVDKTGLPDLEEGEEMDTSGIFEYSYNRFQIESLKLIEGIANVKIESSTPKVSSFSYEFNDINALNASAYLFNQEVIFDPMHTFFKLNGKNELEFSLPRAKRNKKEEDTSGYMNLFLYELDLEFPREIKSITSDCDSLVQNVKSLSINSNVGIMQKMPKSQKTIIKLK